MRKRGRGGSGEWYPPATPNSSGIDDGVARYPAPYPASSKKRKEENPTNWRSRRGSNGHGESLLCRLQLVRAVQAPRNKHPSSGPRRAERLKLHHKAIAIRAAFVVPGALAWVELGTVFIFACVVRLTRSEVGEGISVGHTDIGACDPSKGAGGAYLMGWM